MPKNFKTFKDQQKEKLLFRIAAFSQSSRNDLIGHNFNRLEAAEAIKATSWLLEDLKKRIVE